MNKEQAKYLIQLLLNKHNGDANGAGVLTVYYIDIYTNSVDDPTDIREIKAFFFCLAQALKDDKSDKYDLTRYKALHFWRCCMIDEPGPGPDREDATYLPGFTLAMHLGLPTDIPLLPEYLENEEDIPFYDECIEKLTKFFLTLSQALV